MKYTVGIILKKQFESLYLVVHPTGVSQTVWSIPVGETTTNEKIESFQETALRELYEETNILIPSLYRDKLSYLGNYLYPNGQKILICFFFELPYMTNFDSDLKCNSMVKMATEFPEVDVVEWVSFNECLSRIHVTQKQALLDSKLKI